MREAAGPRQSPWSCRVLLHAVVIHGPVRGTTAVADAHGVHPVGAIAVRFLGAERHRRVRRAAAQGENDDESFPGLSPEAHATLRITRPWPAPARCGARGSGAGPLACASRSS